MHYEWTVSGISAWKFASAGTYAASGSPQPGAPALQMVLDGWAAAGFPLDTLLKNGWVVQA